MSVLSVNTSFQSQKLILKTQISEQDDSFTVNNTMLSLCLNLDDKRVGL